jgi:DNA-binding CsgD family transcriptional regulator
MGHIIEEIIDILRNIKFDRYLPKYKDRLITDLKLKERIIFGNQFFVVFDLQIHDIIFTHDNVIEILGINKKSMNIKALICFIYCDDRYLVFKAVKRIVLEGLNNLTHKPLDDVYCIDCRYNKTDNEIIWLKTEISTLLKDKTGIPFSALIQFTDITENNEQNRFKLYYCGRNANCIKLLKGKPLTYKKSNHLTEREREILLLIVEGNTNKEISQILRITEATVKTHRNNILDKTDQHNYAGLIKWAKKNL